MPVYLIRAGLSGDVKIGTSADPLARLRGLQTSHPHRLRIIRVLHGDRLVERALHKRFSTLRKAGEWFGFTEEMTAKDIGYADLPIPFPKRKTPPANDAWSRRAELHEDILAIIGGAEVFAKKLGQAPWLVAGWRKIEPKFYSAAVVLLRLAGHDHVNVDILWKMDADIAAEDAAEKKIRDASGLKQRYADEERRWLQKHGRDAAWWLPPLPIEDEAGSAA